MAYTEIKKRNGKHYYYRVKSIRYGEKFKKKRIYLGVGLEKRELENLIREADRKFLKDTVDKTLTLIKPKIVKVLKKYNVKRAGVFGSYATGTQRKNSDIDILIEPPKGIGFGFAGIEIDLEKELGRKVDLVTYKYLNLHMKKSVLKDEVRVI